MSDLLNRIGDICFKIPDAIQSAFDKLRGKENIDYPDNYPDNWDVMSGDTIEREKRAARHDAYERLKASFPQVGPYESGCCIFSGTNGWILDFGGVAAIVGPTTWDSDCFEIHGGIYSAWKDSGDVLGPLGRPVSDEADYHGPDARPGDRISEFENGVIVWRADTWQTEVRAKSEVPNAHLSNESSCPSSKPPLEDIVDPDACVMENMERAIEAGYSESEVRAIFLGQYF